MATLSSEVQPSKASLPMDFIIDGRMASRRLVQPSKAELPSFCSDEGNSKFARHLQSRKALLSMVLIPLGRMTVDRDVQPWKVLELISSMLPSMVTLVSDTQFLKASLPKRDSLVKLTAVRLLQFSKSLLPMLLMSWEKICIR